MLKGPTEQSSHHRGDSTPKRASIPQSDRFAHQKIEPSVLVSVKIFIFSTFLLNHTSLEHSPTKSSTFCGSVRNKHPPLGTNLDNHGVDGHPKSQARLSQKELQSINALKEANPFVNLLMPASPLSHHHPQR